MMNLLLSSVSASAIIAGSGGTYPSAAEVTEIYTAIRSTNTFFPQTHTVTVDGSGGNYIVAFFGSWGRSSDVDGSIVSCTCAEALNVRKFHTSESSFDTIIWSLVEMPAGPVTMTLIHDGHSDTVARSSIVVWKTSAINLIPLNYIRETRKNQNSNSVTLTPSSANGMILGVAHTRSTTPHIWSGNPTFHINENIENFWWSCVSYTGGIPANTQTVTVTKPPSASRELMSLVWIPYQSEAFNQSVIIDSDLIYALSGSSRNLGIRQQFTYALANTAGGDRLHINHTNTYFIAIP